MAFDYDRCHDAIAALRARTVFFVGGAPKSGTTWLQLLLNAHPDVSCGGEGHLPNHFGPLLRDAIIAQNRFVEGKNRAIFADLPGYALMTDEDLLHMLGSAIALAMLRQDKGRTVRAIGEKTPDHVMHFALLHALFPRARFIHMVRDGRDCAVSGWFHRARVHPGELASMYKSITQYLPDAAKAWAAIVQSGEEFRAAHPDACMTVRYEDLGVAPLPTVAGLLRFLGVSDDPEIVRTCCETADFRRLSGGRERGDENLGSFFRQGTSGGWRRHFTDETTRTFQRHSSPWLERLGYG